MPRCLSFSILLALPLLLAGCATGGNRVLSLNGQSDFGHVPDQPALRLAAGDYTVAAWAFVQAHGDANNCILSKRGSGNQNGWTFYIAGKTWPALSRKVIFHLSQGDNPFVVSRASIEEGQWYHLCVVYSAAARRLTLYIDGEPDAVTENVPSPNPETDSSLYLGRDSVVGRYFFNGMLDDVGIWNRAFAPEEIKTLAAAHLGGGEEGLLALWTFDRQNLQDRSGNGFDGELIQGATAP
jgi:hypothetical protein